MYKTLITGNTYFAYIIFSSPNTCIWRMNQNRTVGAGIPSLVPWFTRISAASDILNAFTCIGWMKERLYEQTDQKKNFFLNFPTSLIARTIYGLNKIMSVVSIYESHVCRKSFLRSKVIQMLIITIVDLLHICPVQPWLSY